MASFEVQEVQGLVSWLKGDVGCLYQLKVRQKHKTLMLGEYY